MRESRTPLEAHVVFLRMRCFGLSSDLMVSSCQLLSNSVNQCETTLLSLLLSFFGVTYGKQLFRHKLRQGFPERARI